METAFMLFMTTCMMQEETGIPVARSRYFLLFEEFIKDHKIPEIRSAVNRRRGK